MIREQAQELETVDRDKDLKVNLHILQRKYYEIDFKLNNKKYFLGKLKILVHERKIKLRA